MGAKYLRSAYTGVTVSDALIGCVVYERAQGQVDVATDGTVEPLGVVVNIEPDNTLVIAGVGSYASVLLSEDFEYSDCKTFQATTGGQAAVFAPASGTVTTATVAWSVGQVILPYEGKGASGSMQECFIFPKLEVVKAS